MDLQISRISANLQVIFAENCLHRRLSEWVNLVQAWFEREENCTFSGLGLFRHRKLSHSAKLHHRLCPARRFGARGQCRMGRFLGIFVYINVECRRGLAAGGLRCRRVHPDLGESRYSAMRIPRPQVGMSMMSAVEVTAVRKSFQDTKYPYFSGNSRTNVRKIGFSLGRRQTLCTNEVLILFPGTCTSQRDVAFHQTSRGSS